MKKILLIFALLFSIILSSPAKPNKKIRWFEKDPRIEIVNEQTVIFKNVVKIEIRTIYLDQTTYVYDLTHSKMVKIAKGAFVVDLPEGNYLVQSNKKITRTSYELVIE